MRSLTPLLHVQDMLESIAFYQLLGFELEQRMPDEGPPSWVYLVQGSVHLMLQIVEDSMAEARLERDIERDMVLHIGHSDLFSFHAMLSEEGMPVTDLHDDGLPEFMIRDPDGYPLVFFFDEA